MPTIDGITVSPPDADVRIDPVSYFGSPGPVELEIGCGKGGFLLRRAREYSQLRLLGIEWANKYYRYAADRMARWGLTNVRIMRTDARNFVLHHLVPDCLAALHTYHPDPWPKKRHHKRRLFQPDFVAAATVALQPGGRWAIQTDHADYFAWITEVMAGQERLEPIDYEDEAFGIVDNQTQTNYEIKYLREGRHFYRLAFRKKG
ncbi:MAG: tRNA (guanosine(46)-N7)-methyltransferase TrmB [Phycisphaerales bacterium]|nr:MAG: tRNA (guanosine(46)-N7)-methyltransferase TrmB [Phycisphaerales bacterium]